MKIVKLGLVLGALLLPVQVAVAQEKQDDLKDTILKKVEDRLRAEEERILKEISKIIDEELSGWKGGEKKTVVKPKKEGKAPAKKSVTPKEPGFLGVFPSELEAAEMEELGVESGVILREIVENSPAEKAGLKAGDVVFNLNGNPIADLDSFRDVILDMGAGSEMKVGFLRDGKKSWRTVTLASRHEVEEEREENPGNEHSEKPEAPKRDRTEEELRKMTKKFLEKKEEEKGNKPPTQEEESPGIPGLDFLALDEEAFETIRGMLEQFGMDPEQYFQQGDDGKWRPSGELMEMFKQFDLGRFFEQFRENMPDIPGLEKLEELEELEEVPEVEQPKKVEKKKPEKKNGWIGIVPVELSEDEALELKLYKGVGMVVTEVIKGSPAEKAGLEAGDVITYINGKPLRGEESLIAFVRASHVGQKATFTILREGKKKKIRITLGERDN